MRLAIKLILAVIALIIITLIAVPFFIDPNDYKQEIASKVEETTGRKLTMEGDIELSVFPWVALELGQMSLSNADGFKSDVFAKVDTVQVRIKLLPLLKKQIEMDTVVLDGVKLNLETNKAGKTNWEDLIKPSTEEQPAKETETSSTQSNEPALGALNIEGVKLTNSDILWLDDANAQEYQLRNFNLTTDSIQPGTPAALDINFDVLSAQPKAEANISLQTKLLVDMEKQRYVMQDLSFKTTTNADDMPFSQAVIALTGQVDANMASQQITVKDLALALDAALSDPNAPVKEAKLNLNSQAAVDLQKQTLSLADLVIKIQDLTIEGAIQAKQIMSETPAYSGTLHVNPFNLRKLAKELSIELPEMADTRTLELVEVKTNLSGTTNSLKANNLALTLDQSHLTGDISVNNFSQPALGFKLKLDEIDADRYLPPVSEDKQPAPTSTESTNTPDSSTASEELPVEPLRQINAKGTMDIGKLKMTNMRSENIHVTLNAANGLVKLNPMRADMYQGQYQGNVTLDARGDALKLAIDEKITNIQAEPLLTDMSGEAPISGVATANAKLTGTGKTVAQIKQTLTGSGAFKFENGAIKGFNLGELIRKAKAALKGGATTDSSAPVQTDFAELSGSFTAKNGLINNQDLSLKSPLLRVTGAGTASLPKETIDYAVNAAIVGTSKGQGGADLSDLKGLKIPVKITGTFTEPKPTVDLENLLKGQATEQLKSKAEEKLKEKLGADLGGLVGGALGNKSQENEEPADSTADEETQPDKPEDALKDALKSFF